MNVFFALKGSKLFIIIHLDDNDIAVFNCYNGFSSSIWHFIISRLLTVVILNYCQRHVEMLLYVNDSWSSD